MKKLVLSLLAASVVFSGVSFAQIGASSLKPMKDWKCKDFLQVEDSFQPTAVQYVVLSNDKDNIENAVLDVEGLSKASTSTRTICQTDPEVPFALTVKEVLTSLANEANQ